MMSCRFSPTLAGLIIFIPLDVFRFRLMGRPGTLVSLVGLVLLATGWWVIVLALRKNAFAAPVVKHQEERHQRVIGSGVYSTVLHPICTGFVPFVVRDVPMAGVICRGSAGDSRDRGDCGQDPY